MIKIFYNNKEIIISENVVNKNSVAKISFSDKECIKNSINNFLNNEELSELNIYGVNENIILSEIESFFTKVQAAGGIVENISEKLLFIKRLGVWDLPKGKIEKNETVEYAAIREICEECGISKQDLYLDKFIQRTYHIYQFNNKNILKEIFWYRIKFIANYELHPQIEENIIATKWVDKKDLENVLQNTYPSIKNLINYYLSRFQ